MECVCHFLCRRRRRLLLLSSSSSAGLVILVLPRWRAWVRELVIFVLVKMACEEGWVGAVRAKWTLGGWRRVVVVVGGRGGFAVRRFACFVTYMDGWWRKATCEAWSVVMAMAMAMGPQLVLLPPHISSGRCRRNLPYQYMGGEGTKAECGGRRVDRWRRLVC
ncbi:hypothetical protein BT67DRAFT_70236 [Trichocladium antarcticum]|uniref:Uncharacterized protein n=1 Tax=Trichocladium antarcticum TaxID=1450529 RepID=A0AAN6UHD5_9PEZI|nr:hypothetical protein BT67DRAFT_70236 [Trichocladium antarcticum]